MDNGINNIFDGSQFGWSVVQQEEVNIGEWLRQNEANIVFKIYINQEPRYFLSNLDNLELTLSTIFFGCDMNTRVLLNKTYVNLKYIGLDHFLLEYTDDLWPFFGLELVSDKNSEHSFGEQTRSSRKRLAKGCFYLKTNKQSVAISNTPIKIPSDAYNDYHLRNILPPINCSQIDNTYRLITDVEHGIFKNNLDEESSQEQSNISSISSITSKSYNFLNKPSPDNSEDEYSVLSPLTPERGGRTQKRKNKNKLKKTKKTKQSKKSKKTNKNKRKIKKSKKSKK